jgi:hypothetical protein
MEHTLTLTNQKVWNFYDEHKNLDFENMNILFVDILDNLLRNTNPTLDANIAATLLDNMKTLQGQINNIGNTVAKNQTDISTMFTMKFIDFKREYMEDMKLILSTNATDKVAPIIKEYNDALLDKTRIMVSEIVPKNNDVLHRSLENSLQQLQTSINTDTNNLLKLSVTTDVLDKFSSSLDDKFATTLMNSQNLLNSLITSTEQRIDTRLTEIKDISSTNSSSQVSLCNNISDLLKKMENSSSKGKISENLLFNVLHSLYPTAQIESVGTTKETGDIILKRKDKPIILFENKNYDRNVGQEEVRKFLRDVEIQNCSGIMLAQHFGITNKNNFEIELHNNNVLLYLHKVEYDADKIKAAIDSIDYFKSCLDELEKDSGEQINMSKDFLDDINKEYQNFVNNKLTHIKTIKDFQQKLISQVDDIKLPSLEHYLSRMYASSASKENICDYCNYVAKNVRALTAHHRGCALKKQHEQQKRDKLTQTLTNENTTQYNPTVL